MILKPHFQIEQHCWETDNCCVRQQLLHFEFDFVIGSQEPIKNICETFTGRESNNRLEDSITILDNCPATASSRLLPLWYR